MRFLKDNFGHILLTFLENWIWCIFSKMLLFLFTWCIFMCVFFFCRFFAYGLYTAMICIPFYTMLFAISFSKLNKVTRGGWWSYKVSEFSPSRSKINGKSEHTFWIEIMRQLLNIKNISIFYTLLKLNDRSQDEIIK